MPAPRTEAELIDQRKNLGIRLAIAQMLTPKLFTEEEKRKTTKLAHKNRYDLPLLESYKERTAAEVQKRTTPQMRAERWERIVCRAVEAELRRAHDTRVAEAKELAKQKAQELLNSIEGDTIEGYDKAVILPALAGVLNPSFVYSKQRQDGGITIYGRDSLSPSGVYAIGGAEHPAAMGIAGKLAKRNAYVGQQWEKLN